MKTTSTEQFLSLRVIVSRFIHTVACATTPAPLYGWAILCWMGRLYGDRHSSCSRLLAIMNNTAVSIYLQVFAWTCILVSLRYTPKRGFLGLTVMSEKPPGRYPMAAALYITTNNLQRVWDVPLLQPLAIIRLSDCSHTYWRMCTDILWWFRFATV